MELLGSKYKKFQETETPKQSPYISGNGTSKKTSYISRKRSFQSTPIKLLILHETKVLKKFLMFSQKKTVLMFWKKETTKKLFIFQEAELSYISGKLYSEF